MPRSRRSPVLWLLPLFLLAALTTPPSVVPAAAQTAEETGDQDVRERLRAHSDEISRLWDAGEYAAVLPRLEAVRRLAPELQGGPDVSRIDYYRARIHALLGQETEALEQLAAAVDGGFDDLVSLTLEEDLAGLRDEPAFAELVQRVRERVVLQWSDRPEEPWEGTFDAPGSAGMRRLRNDHGLDELVAGAADDHERLRRIVGWAHRAFGHDGSNEASSSDPLTILAEGAEGESFRCLEFGIVVAAAATAVGLPGRVLSLATRDVETNSSAAGHVAAEVWLADAGRWAFADGQFGLVPELDGEPVTALELRRAILAGDPRLRCPAVDEAGTSCDRYASFVLPYLYHFFVKADQSHFAGDAADGGSVEPQDVMLLPAGAPMPRLFQGRPGPYDEARPIRNPAAFYPPPPPAALSTPPQQRQPEEGLGRQPRLPEPDQPADGELHQR